MALQKQNVEVIFDGIEQKTESKLVVAGKLTTLENGQFDKIGTINKRVGLSEITEVSGASTTKRLLNYRNELLAQNDNKGLYSYSESTLDWEYKGILNPCEITTESVLQNNGDITQCDMAVIGNLACYASINSQSDLNYTIIDLATNTINLSATVSGTFSGARVTKLDDNFVITYISGTDLLYRYIDVDDLNTVSTGTALSGVTDVYDTFELNSELIIAAAVSGASEIDIIIYSSTMVSQHTKTISQAADTAINVTADASNNVYVSFDDSNDTYTEVLNDSLVTQTASTQTNSATYSGGVTKITAIPLTSSITVVATEGASNSYDYLTHLRTITSGGSVSTPSTPRIRSVEIVSKPFTYNDFPYFIVCYEDTTQPTYFMVDTAGRPVAKIKGGLAGGHTSSCHCVNVFSTGTGSFLTAILVKGKLRVDDGTLFANRGVFSCAIDLESVRAGNFATLGKNLHITGGILSMYDGRSVSEHGFLLFPVINSLTESGGAGSIAAGTYSYVAVYEWTDNHGQIHRSAPSAPVSITLGSSKDVTVDVTTLRITLKTSSLTGDVRIGIYRTEDGGSIYYRVSDLDLASAITNNTAVDSVTFDDDVTDANLISNELLYTTGGILENIAAPACTDIVTQGDRVWLSGLEDKNKVLYSKINVSGEPVEFSDTLALFIDDLENTALAKLDEKVVVFKKAQPHVIFGEGPNNTGQLGQYDSEAINSDKGAINGNSVVSYPQGIIFKTVNGIYRLTTAGQIDYIGSAVEDFNSETIVGTAVLAKQNHIRFLTSAGNCLVYDYYQNKWSSFTAHAGNDCVEWDDEFVFIDANDDILISDSTTYKDNSSAYNLLLETGWINLAGLAGYQRVYRFAILGEYFSAHTLRVSVAYNFSDSYDDVYDYTPSASDPYLFRAHLSRQKCSSIRFKIESTLTDESSGAQQAFSISAMILQAGLKGGINRSQTTQSIGEA